MAWWRKATRNRQQRYWTCPPGIFPFKHQKDWPRITYLAYYRRVSWLRHQMETFSALLAPCAENSPVTGEFHAQRPVTRSFDILFDLRLNKRLSKQSWGWWFETLSRPLWRHSNVSSLSFKTSPKERAFEIITTKNQKYLILKSTPGLLMGISWGTDIGSDMCTNQQFTVGYCTNLLNLFFYSTIQATS